MATAVAPNFEEAPEPSSGDGAAGAQRLLTAKPQHPHYGAQLGAAALYALLLGAVVTLTFKTAEAPVEEEQVMEIVPVPVEEEQVEDTPPPLEELALPEPPPPPMMDPIAPVEEKPLPPKPIEKPKIEKKVEKPPKPHMEAKPRAEAKPAATPARTPSARTAPGPRSDAPAVRAPAAPPGATPSAVANHFYSCLQRAASGADAPMAGRVTYRASFSATGSMTSFSPSGGNGALVAIASRLAGRCGSVPAPGKPVSLSGGVTFSP